MQQPQEDAYLALVARRVRDLRAQRGMTRRTLARDSGISERYLAQLESGTGNPTISILRALAQTLRVPIGLLVAEHDDGPRRDRIALVGLRGAGKSTLGAALAARLEVPFIELDREVEREASASLAEIMEFYGQAGFRRFERNSLDRILERESRFVLATGGGIVSDQLTYERLLASCYTIWLRAEPAEHMARVVAQGDMRPMAGNREAMDDLRRILASREALYTRADATVSTSNRGIDETVAELVSLSSRA